MQTSMEFTAWLDNVPTSIQAAVKSVGVRSVLMNATQWIRHPLNNLNPNLKL